MAAPLIGAVPNQGSVDDFANVDANGIPRLISPVWSEFFQQLQRAGFAIYQSGTTAQRPTKNIWIGRPYFDTTLGVPVWAQSIAWGVVTWVAGGGTPGPTGAAGPTGPAAFLEAEAGDEGIPLPGPAGAVGAAGATGAAGAAGAFGMDGDTGADGDIGPQGVPGPQGFMGLLGPQGFDGLDGDDGAMGPAGAAGAAGTNGVIGVNGSPGNDGDQGDDGLPVPGPQGATGPTGATGAVGTPVTMGSFIVDLTNRLAARSGRVLVENVGPFTQKQIDGPVIVQQLSAVILDRGEYADDAEMDPIMCSGQIVGPRKLILRWTTRGKIRGEFKFAYMAAAA